MKPNGESVGDLMTLDDWIEDVEIGALIDYDGHGYMANATEHDETIQVLPSEVRAIERECKACGHTHILWFNR